MSSPALKTITLGCKVNQYETEYVRQGLISAGYHDADKEEVAELCIVNTCTVTSEGDSKSRQMIRQLSKRNPGTRIVVMGCYATREPDAVRQLPSVVEVVTDKRELPDLLGRFGVVDVPTGISTFGDRQRAYVKVQDGCLLKCSYCIIPKVRPNLASRPLQPILDEVRRLADNGYKEIVLTGIHLGHYGVDFNQGKPKAEWLRLSHLVEEILKVRDGFRVRLSSIEATEVTRELIATMTEHQDRVCPHLHVCLQSGSDRILRKMKRRWGAKRFVDRCRLVAEHLENPAFTTDVMVGFPGETEEDFQQTLNICQEIGFSKIHIFPFSPRRTTPAATMEDQLPGDVKKERLHRLAEVERVQREQYFNRLVGKEVEVLAEMSSTENSSLLRGTACRYAPVEFSADEDQLGKLVKVRVTDSNDHQLQGELIEVSGMK